MQRPYDTMIYLLTGSNIGDALANLKRAVNLLSERVGEVLQLSSFYKTEPWGNKNQQAFLNQALEIKTNLSPEILMQKILQIEAEMGRVRNEKWSPRVIDIDILFYGNQIVKQENLIIPHPFLQERKFVLEPMNEIASEFVHPVFNKTIAQLLSECSDEGVVEKM